MSDTTAQPADTTNPAPRPQPPAQAQAATGDAPEQPKSDETDWKAEARKWEQRAKDNKAAAEAASKTEAEKVAERLAEVEKRAAEAEARVLRRDVALEHKLSRQDAALLDNLTDEAAIRAFAQRLADGQVTDNYVPDEGNNPRSTAAGGSWAGVLAELDAQRT